MERDEKRLWVYGAKNPVSELMADHKELEVKSFEVM
jgi:hypothetical protein